ncbi:prefoldin subunit alpha [Candidatus Thorarchaeota archaeon]|jgi:prefoldin alpha subunit|nr:MAG: prefoldin subunit alpha [Candidatus Thorarchaeota archaeon]
MSEEQQKLLQRIYAQQQMVEQNIALYQQQLELIQTLIRSYQSGLLILEELEKKEEGEEMLMEIGGNIQVQAKLVEPSKVIRGIGKNIKIEQSTEDAKSALTEQIERFGKQHDALRQEYEKNLAQAQALSNQFDQIAAQVQGAMNQSQEE